MITSKRIYESPVCEVQEDLAMGMLCQSSTENFEYEDDLIFSSTEE